MDIFQAWSIQQPGVSLIWTAKMKLTAILRSKNIQKKLEAETAYHKTDYSEKGKYILQRIQLKKKKNKECKADSPIELDQSS